jgi:sortase A
MSQGLLDPSLERTQETAVPRRGAQVQAKPHRTRRWWWLVSWPLRRAVVMVIAMAGVGLLLAPAAANWFSDREHTAAVGGYVHAIEAMTPADVQAALNRAHRYNESLPSGALRDPYALGPQGQQTAAGQGADRYFRTLDAGPDGMMGVIQVPAIHVSLPIYHGTAPGTLARGVGHLYGSALPVGGQGTHSVLTGHSGIVGSTLLTHLDRLRRGDEFTITILNQTLTYRVDRILTVLPNETAALRSVPGKDFVTLVTCTPTGVNTHRLLVRGVRVHDAQPAATPMEILGGATQPGFPWWAVMAAGCLAGGITLTSPLGSRQAGGNRARRRRRHRAGRPRPRPQLDHRAPNQRAGRGTRRGDRPGR